MAAEKSLQGCRRQTKGLRRNPPKGGESKLAKLENNEQNNYKQFNTKN